jgi:chromate transporter
VKRFIQGSSVTEPVKQPGFKELFTTFGKVGLLSFGGPAAQIAMLQRILVDEKKWMDQERLIHALNFCMLLPGPEAMQLATYSGWAVKGWRGGLLAGLLFGLEAAVLAVVFEALYRMPNGHWPRGFPMRWRLRHSLR